MATTGSAFSGHRWGPRAACLHGDSTRGQWLFIHRIVVMIAYGPPKRSAHTHILSGFIASHGQGAMRQSPSRKSVARARCGKRGASRHPKPKRRALRQAESALESPTKCARTGRAIGGRGRAPRDLRVQASAQPSPAAHAQRSPTERSRHRLRAGRGGFDFGVKGDA